jgi:hypothetical protein
MSNYTEFPDLEIVELRKRIRELESSLSQAQAVLRENDLLDAKAIISDEESICIRQIAKFKELSDKNIPFQDQDFKNLETLVKTLLAIRGKTIVAPADKKKKKEEKPDVAKLLAIAGNKNFERD